jgi:co-chaperonin GroES (HSP10)
MNTSGLIPKGVAVLLEPYIPEVKDSILDIPDSVKRRQASIDLRARVIAVGPAAWQDEPEPRAQIGDLVLVTQYAGVLATGPADGKQYRLVNDRDIYCVTTEVQHG